MNESTTEKLPLWRSCLEKMREDGLGYGVTWPASFFEHAMRCPKDSQEFAFGMLALKQEMEKEDGYYLKSEESGSRWSIVQAGQHEDVAQMFDGKVRRYAVRAIAIRSATLQNPTAELSADERKKMEANLEKASLRLVLMSRAGSISKVVQEHSPKLLSK